jgi:hypothetical protein
VDKEESVIYEDIINSLPKCLRKHVGGDRELTEELWKKGRFKLLSFKVGDKIRLKGANIEDVVIAVHRDGVHFETKGGSGWWNVPWADHWEKI